MASLERAGSCETAQSATLLLCVAQATVTSVSELSPRTCSLQNPFQNRPDDDRMNTMLCGIKLPQDGAFRMHRHVCAAHCIRRASPVLRRSHTACAPQRQTHDAMAAHSGIADALNAGQDAATPQWADDTHSRYWAWTHPARPRVHYWRVGDSGPPVLLLHGFGVGCFHFDGVMEELKHDHRLWAMDFLGQGRSWPESPDSAEGLAYSVDLWTQQVKEFIDSEIGEPVWLVGNSLGGFVAASVAALHPDFVRGVVFLNATPWWAFNPAPISEVVAAQGGPMGQAVEDLAISASDVVSAGSSAPEPSNRAVPQPGAAPSERQDTHNGSLNVDASGSGIVQARSKGLLWGGNVPAPGWVQQSLRWLWNWIRDGKTIQKLLQQVYARKHLADQTLADRIRQATDNPLAFDAFLSILFAPAASAGTFDEMLVSIRQAEKPMLCCYGKEDPWVRSIWAQRIVRIVPEAPLYYVTPGGHCPQAEAPELVARCLASWIRQHEHGEPPLLEVDEEVTDGDGVVLLRTNDRPTNTLERIVWVVYRCTTLFKRFRSGVDAG